MQQSNQASLLEALIAAIIRYHEGNLLARSQWKSSRNRQSNHMESGSELSMEKKLLGTADTTSCGRGKALLASDGSYSFKWIPRALNGATDKIMKMAPSDQLPSNCIWRELSWWSCLWCGFLFLVGVGLAFCSAMSQFTANLGAQ